MRITGFVLGFALLATPGMPAEFPGFTWDRVPLNIHFGKRTGDLTDAEIEFLATHSRFIALEKSHGVIPHGSTEAGIAATARRLKQRNPEVKVLFYFNAFINWPGYDAFKTYRPEWTLLTAAGEVVTHPSGTPRPDPSNPEFREWWSEVVAQAHREAPLEGLFADALPQALSPALARQVGTEKARAIIDGLRAMLALTKRKLGPGRLVLANGLRTTDFREILDWEGIDGVMIEHFGAFKTDRPEDIKADLDSMALAAAKGKFVVLKGWPGFNWLDQDMMKRPYAELLQLARERLTFPLACFLVAARSGDHFCYSWGYTDRHGMLDAYPEFARPLGPPKGDAVWQGLTAKREYAHASVSVNLTDKSARIDWRPTDAPSTPIDSAEARARVEALAQLTKAPRTFPAEGFAGDGVRRPLFFEALPWKGNTTRVFAWLGIPAAPAGARLSGIVLVQGGGGTAFKEWVQKWNDQGFAAISIAVEGQTDERNPAGGREQQWKRHAWAGPGRRGIYGDSGEPLADQWMFHAVADTVLANSLLRSRPEVDPAKVGLMGISWGGVITSTVMGIDPRFAFAIPTYGCGHLADADNQYGRALGNNTLYREVWDPMLRLDRARMPALWLSWPGDEHFPLDCQAACYRAAPGPRMVALVPNLKHSHPAAWNPPHSYAFARSIVAEGRPWLRVVAADATDGRVRMEVESSRPLDRAVLFATPDRGFTSRRAWTEIALQLAPAGRRAVATGLLPAGTNAWFVNVHSGDLLASSDFHQNLR
jgi:dienelactone hydrolase